MLRKSGAERRRDCLGVFLNRRDRMAARRLAALRIALMRIATAEVQNLGLPAVPVSQLGDTASDQPGCELEMLGGRTEAADMQMQPAQSHALVRKRARHHFEQGQPIHPPLVVTAIRSDLAQIIRKRCCVGIAEGEHPEADISSTADLLGHADDQLEFARIIDVERHAGFDSRAHLVRLLVAPVHDKLLGRHAGQQ